jgi:hypothetical protein
MAMEEIGFFTGGVMSDLVSVNEAAIWDRMIQPLTGSVPPEVAKFFRALGFADSDKQRMHELAERNQDGSLADTESEELRRYRMVGLQVDLLRSISRRSLAAQ